MAVTIPGSDLPAAPTCIGCGYDLRAQPADGKCPECGTDVDRSMHGFWLRYSDQQWVGTVRRGLNWVWAGMGILVGVVLLALFSCAGLLFMPEAIAAGGVLRAVIYLNTLAVVLGLPLAGGGLLAGLLLFTTPEPRREGREPHRTTRLRVLTIALVPIVGLAWLGTWRTVAAPAGIAWWEALPQLAAPLAIGAQAVLLLHHVRAIERRCCGFDEVREKHLQTYRRTILGFAIVATLGTIAVYLSVGVASPSGLMMGLPWLAAVGQVGETRTRIQAELSILSAEEKIDAGPTI